MAKIFLESICTSSVKIRWFYLVVAAVAMLFTGTSSAWSILKVPLLQEFGWNGSALALPFTLNVCFFCLGGLGGGLLGKRIGFRYVLIVGGLLAGCGFMLVSRIGGDSILPLYLGMGTLNGLGIGAAYNAVISMINDWFPDKKGLVSGCLFMSNGAFALVLGNLLDTSIIRIGWRSSYLYLGIAAGLAIMLAGLILQVPSNGTLLPQAKEKASARKESFEERDFSPAQMLRRPSFWLAFFCIVFMAAAGNSVISFARDLATSVGTSATLATTLVGVLSICIGLSCIATGTLFDIIGRRSTMLLANILTIIAAVINLLAVLLGSVPLCIVGLCLTGFAYGSCPTLSSVFTAAFYGIKHFSVNFSIMNFTVMTASFMATISGALLTAFQSYAVIFAVLIGLTLIALILNLSIKRP